ncbi:hypothetical protein ORI89_17165 [Sphingobacterium sp. UT-1RO-CII-1]|uniref:calcium:proton antiporter n=1 Tax=Sphingobacterium sp. UT-1RO-CII-1 TaxID=2995225 RepID=UPI00227B8CF2|nr:hypothetical protein [Sphingobacterium sp. UT-1RO-CII-1]MCY4781392.1 hypothetical protein [Sphingobacterium sp. UT-1RO-CII-1]
MERIFSKQTCIRLIFIWTVVIAFLFILDTSKILSGSSTVALLSFIALLTTIIIASFGVVQQADELAHKLGEPYGTLILTLSIVSIEVVLISAVMLGPTETPTIGKDSIFSVMMIIMNLVIGLCILVGGLKYGEQEYNAQGSISYHGMIILLSGISMLLPNFITGAGNAIFSTVQAMTITTLIIIIYTFFLRYQMISYSHLYVQPKTGSMEILYTEKASYNKDGNDKKKVNIKEIWLRTIILLAMILPIVLLSHNLATYVDHGIQSLGLPLSLGGVLIAIIVFTPESITAVKAAMNNEFQRVINLCHGAFVSTVGLTVPAVLIIGLISGKTVMFGLSSSETILFVITLLLSLMNFLGKRTVPLTGLMHLALFVIFILLLFNP